VLLGTLINAELGEPASLIVDYQMYDVSVRAHAFIILIFYTTSVLG
jgi:heme/copper-type cytochrome/quinol oxidase subunit 1